MSEVYPDAGKSRLVVVQQIPRNLRQVLLSLAASTPGNHDLHALAAEAQLPPDLVRRTLDPGTEVPPWAAFGRLLKLLGASREEFERCEAWYVAGRRALAPHIAAIGDEREFMREVRTLYEMSGISLRRLEEAMLARDRHHVWGKTALGEKLGADTIPAKTAHLRNLLAVLCDAADRPLEHVNHFLWIRSELCVPPEIRAQPIEFEDDRERQWLAWPVRPLLWVPVTVVTLLVVGGAVLLAAL